MSSFYVLFPFLSAAMYGLGYILVEKLLKNSVDIITFTFFSGLALTTVVGIAGLFKKGSFSVEFLHDPKVLMLFVIAITVNAGGWIVTQLALKHTSAEFVGFAELSYPVFTLAFLFLIFGQKEFNWLNLVGGALVLAGAVVMVYAQSKSST